MKNFLRKFICCSVILFGAIFISACGKEEEKVELSEQEKIYNMYLANTTSRGETPLSYEQWLAAIKGEKGDKGDKGEIGQTGASGITPHIGSNGNWWIGEKDTGVAARGEQGNSILSIEKTNTIGNIDTYTITFKLTGHKSIGICRIDVPKESVFPYTDKLGEEFIESTETEKSVIDYWYKHCHQEYIVNFHTIKH